MRTPISQRQQDLQAQIAEASGKAARLKEDLRALEQLQDNLPAQRQQYQLLTEICGLLDKLHGMGGAGLLWAAQHSHETPEQGLQRMRRAVAEFQQKVITAAQSRSSLSGNIQEQMERIALLNNQLAEAREEEEKASHEYIVEREARAIPYRPIIMPWSAQGDDEQRYRKILLAFLLLALSGGVLMSFWKLPPPNREQEMQVPERLARLIKKKQVKIPEPKLPKEKPAWKKEEINPAKETLQVPAATRQARAKAETKGVLAFKNNLTALVKDSSAVRLGANARISNSGRGTGDAPQRPIIVAQQAITAQSGSGGISTSNLSRQVVSNAGKSLASPEVKLSRIESAVKHDAKESGHTLSNGSGPSRTDEEIQIVFDRYKSALYRIYNRELRNDPALHGKMVLRITIEPNGHVSACSIKSTDLASAALSADIVERVLKFNFGPKEGVPSVVILYPINFLPAN